MWQMPAAIGPPVPNIVIATIKIVNRGVFVIIYFRIRYVKCFLYEEFLGFGKTTARKRAAFRFIL
jgi:hypothetical protein